ncbi:M48 family metallopeptidase [Chloroflexota bacterium]
MTNSQTIDIDGIGSVLFEKSTRARRLIISVRPTKPVRVAIPLRSSFNNALEFVHLKKSWIQKQLVKIKNYENRNEALRYAFLTVDKADATITLKDRLSHMAIKHGFTYNKVNVRDQKTRWGSCSHKNNISLNVKLIVLPEELIDYVILHELVHTLIHNHSSKFWAELDKYTNSKIMAKRLRMNDLRVF